MFAIRLELIGNAAVAVLATAACLIGAAASVANAEDLVGAVRSARVSAMAVLPAIDLDASDVLAPSAATNTFCGGVSDLVVVEQDRRLRFWALTDRGPKGTVRTASGSVGVLLAPDFRPAIFELELEPHGEKTPSGLASVSLRHRMAFQGQSKTPVTGRPNGCDGDERIMDRSTLHQVVSDPNGIDSEGLARLSNGTIWLGDEYRPSLVEVSADGTLVSRHVPRGISLPGADCEVRDSLPARYASRKLNRGFEAVAVSPDETTLWALLQSPLEYPHPKAAKRSGNVRLLAFDLRDKKPVGEFIYRLGDPTDPVFASEGAPPDDGKLCGMAAIDATSVLVLEQADDGTAKLYRCSFSGATNTLADDRPLETVVDLAAVGVAMLDKSLVADLGPLMPGFASDITAGAWRPKPHERVAGLKIEGVAIIDPLHIALVNDNDFNVDHLEDPSKPVRHTCLWIVSLSEPLTAP